MSEKSGATCFRETPANFREFLLGCKTMFKNRTAIVEHHGKDRRSLSYRQMVDEVGRISAYLSQNGVNKSDNIALLSENRLEWISFALAALNIGAILVPLDTNLTVEEITTLLRRARAKLLVASRSFLVPALQSREKYQPSLPVICFDPIKAGESLVAWVEVQQTDPSAGSEEVAISSDDCALLVFTSGTTSDPKAVVLSHRNILSSAWWSFKHLGNVVPETRLFFAIPLFHMFTFTSGLMVPMMTGGTVLLGSSLKPNQFQTELQSSRPTILIGVPLIYESVWQSIHSKLQAKPAMIRSLLRLHAWLTKMLGARRMKRISRRLYAQVHAAFGGDLADLVSGGASLRPEVAQAFDRLGFTMLQGYGMTEAGPVIATESPSSSRLGSVGQPLPHLDVRIKEPDSCGIGEIQVKGESVMPGYDGAEALNAQAFDQGWLKTGDLGYLDRDGYLFICGRNKDVIVTPGGRKIYPEDLERLYLQSPWIKEICIHEKTGHHGFEGLQATIVANLNSHEENLTEEQATQLIFQDLQRIAQELPLYKRIEHITLSKEELAKTTLRKLRRHKIHEQFSQPSHPELHAKEAK